MICMTSSSVRDDISHCSTEYEQTYPQLAPKNDIVDLRPFLKVPTQAFFLLIMHLVGSTYLPR